MIEQFLAPENSPFAVALMIMVLLGFIEGIGMSSDSEYLTFSTACFQTSTSTRISISTRTSMRRLIRGLGGHGVEIGHVDQIGPFTRMLSWLRVGRVPILILAVIFLLAFGLGGLLLQAVVSRMLGAPLPTLVAVVPALFFGVGSMNVLGGLAENIVPRDESSAVSSDSFVGRVATITLGNGRELDRPRRRGSEINISRRTT